uniref:tRNA/rRNA methyltransferase SpoU type domain-containing protein n=1 Tax=Lepisosteus oculatus TaxID=7918 RepID=W5MG82_LEPOC
MAAFLKRASRGLFNLESNIFLTVQENQCIVAKRYVRALRRKPVRVLYPENESDDPSTSNSFDKTGIRTQPATSTPRKSAEKGKRPPLAESVKKSGAPVPVSDPHDELHGLRYEKAFPGDKRLAPSVGNLHGLSYSDEFILVLCAARMGFASVIPVSGPNFKETNTISEKVAGFPETSLQLAALNDHVWGEEVRPPPPAAIFSQPEPSQLAFPPEQREHALPLSLVCDNIRDPGNLGTILRSAAAAGCQRVLLTRGCVDVWEPKVLRAAMGAHFRLPIIPGLPWSEIPRFLEETVTVHLADNCSPAGETPGEGAPSTAPRKAEGGPGPRNSHSRETPADSDSDSDSEEEEEAQLSLPVVEAQLYHEDWARSHTAVVIGGETHGLSLEALLLAQRTRGRRLAIPMVPGVDSLNSAMAASILLFEAKRQLSLRGKHSSAEARAA